VLFADYEPYIDLETAERVLERLRENLVPLIDAVQESDAELTTDAFAGQFDDDDQEALARDVLDSLGLRLGSRPPRYGTASVLLGNAVRRARDDPL